MPNINLHPGQSLIYDTMFQQRLKRYGVVVCCRGWGKSYFGALAAVTKVYELLTLGNKANTIKTVFLIAPTHDQVTDLYYPIIAYDFGLKNLSINSSKDRGYFELPNRVFLRLVSYEAVERIRSKGAYFVVWDEISSCTKGIRPKEAWEGIIQPAIVTRWSKKQATRLNMPPGGALFISTPKGFNFLEEAYNYQDFDDEWCSFKYDYTEAPLLDNDEIERQRNKLDPVEFATEYLALFKESGNSVFYNFDRKLHLDKHLEPFNTNEVVYCGIDFNVGLQCTSFFALRGKEMHYLDEMKGHPDTESLAVSIKAKYPKHRIVAFPDPTGKSRKTSAAVGRTDLTILSSNGIKVLARPKSPSIVDSVASVNRKLLTAAGKTTMFFHPEKCKGTISSMEKTKWLDKNPDTATIDKSEGVEHYSDNVRYSSEYLFPITKDGPRIVTGFGF